MAIREGFFAPEQTITLPAIRLREFLSTILPTLFIGLILMVFVVQPTRVEGISMEPTLHTGQQLVIEKVSYYFDKPAPGDVVVIKLEREYNPYLVKRVIATEGDEVKIQDGHVYVNGVMQEEANVSSINSENYPTTIVPKGHLFVLGDNRDASNDSRYFGTIPTEYLIGRALASYWPLDKVGPVN